MELRYLFSAHRRIAHNIFIMLFISTEFHENISKGFRVIEQTQNYDRRSDRMMDRMMDRQTDRQTDRQGDYYRASANFVWWGPI